MKLINSNIKKIWFVNIEGVEYYCFAENRKEAYYTALEEYELWYDIEDKKDFEIEKIIEDKNLLNEFLKNLNNSEYRKLLGGDIECFEINKL